MKPIPVKTMKCVVLIGCLERAFKKTTEEKRPSINEGTKKIKRFCTQLLGFFFYELLTTNFNYCESLELV